MNFTRRNPYRIPRSSCAHLLRNDHKFTSFTSFGYPRTAGYFTKRAVKRPISPLAERNLEKITVVTGQSLDNLAQCVLRTWCRRHMRLAAYSRTIEIGRSRASMRVIAGDGRDDTRSTILDFIHRDTRRDSR